MKLKYRGRRALISRRIIPIWKIEVGTTTLKFVQRDLAVGALIDLTSPGPFVRFLGRWSLWITTTED